MKENMHKLPTEILAHMRGLYEGLKSGEYVTERVSVHLSDSHRVLLYSELESWAAILKRNTRGLPLQEAEVVLSQLGNMEEELAEYRQDHTKTTQLLREASTQLSQTQPKCTKSREKTSRPPVGFYIDIKTQELSYLFGYRVHSKANDLEVYLDLPVGQRVVSLDVFLRRFMRIEDVGVYNPKSQAERNLIIEHSKPNLSAQKERKSKGIVDFTDTANNVLSKIRH